jgi:hypothetical protein
LNNLEKYEFVNGKDNIPYMETSAVSLELTKRWPHLQVLETTQPSLDRTHHVDQWSVDYLHDDIPSGNLTVCYGKWQK